MNERNEHPAARAPSLPTVEANLFNANALAGKIRVTFGQQWAKDGDIAWFSAVSLDLSNAAQLRDVLEQMIGAAEGQLAEKGRTP